MEKTFQRGGASKRERFFNGRNISRGVSFCKWIVFSQMGNEFSNVEVVSKGVSDSLGWSRFPKGELGFKREGNRVFKRVKEILKGKEAFYQWKH